MEKRYAVSVVATRQRRNVLTVFHTMFIMDAANEKIARALAISDVLDNECLPTDGWTIQGVAALPID